MKKLIAIMTCTITLSATISLWAESLKVLVKPSDAPFTSESVQFRVVFTNVGDKAVWALKPVVGTNMSIRVYDKTGEELACTRMSSMVLEKEHRDVQRERILLKPLETWESEIYELFSIVHPAFRIAANQEVRIEVICSVNNKQYISATSLYIPPPDLRIKPEYISKKRAMEIAKSEIGKRPELRHLIGDIKPEVQCVNGSYRVAYLRSLPAGVRGSSTVFSMKIDATTGQVLQMQGAGD